LRGHKRYIRISQHFIEPESSLPCSQESSIAHYPEPDQSSSCHPILSHQEQKTFWNLNYFLHYKSPVNSNFKSFLRVYYMSLVNNICKIKKNQLEIYGQPISFVNEAKYLGINLDVRLKWKEHIKKEKDGLEIIIRNLSWLIGRRSQMTINNKLLIYKQILRPMWQYGAQLWGCSKQSNINIIQISK
jgi:hypothetical protein